MDERAFWQALEHRIGRKFPGFEDRRLRYLTCDGLVPERYDLAVDQPSVRGLAYCGQSGQERWQFTLLLGGDAHYSLEQIDWRSLVPSDDVTGWLNADPVEKTLVIDPRAGHPDR